MLCSALALTFSIASMHLDPNGMNQLNPGAGLECFLSERFVLEAGEYSNSDFRHTNFAGVQWRYFNNAHWSIGTRLDAVSGYAQLGRVGLGSGPFAEYRHNRVAAAVNFIPNPMDWKRSCFGFQLKWRIYG